MAMKPTNNDPGETSEGFDQAELKAVMAEARRVGHGVVAMHRAGEGGTWEQMLTEWGQAGLFTGPLTAAQEAAVIGAVVRVRRGYDRLHENFDEADANEGADGEDTDADTLYVLTGMDDDHREPIKPTADRDSAAYARRASAEYALKHREQWSDEDHADWWNHYLKTFPPRTGRPSLTETRAEAIARAVWYGMDQAEAEAGLGLSVDQLRDVRPVVRIKLEQRYGPTSWFRLPRVVTRDEHQALLRDGYNRPLIDGLLLMDPIAYATSTPPKALSQARFDELLGSQRLEAMALGDDHMLARIDRVAALDVS